jgi:hypothetical protein
MVVFGLVVLVREWKYKQALNLMKLGATVSLPCW